MNGLERRVIKQGVAKLMRECEGCGLKRVCGDGYRCQRLENALDKMAVRINQGGEH